MSTSSGIIYNDQVIQNISTVKRINNLLNSSQTRTEGLELLNSFLSQCPDEDFLHFCISWMQNCCKIDGLTKNRDFTIHLLCNLLKISSDYQELKKSVSFFITTRFFDFFFKYFLNSRAGWSCIETCLLLYRGACGPFQETLEKHLQNEINKNTKISQTISRCFALMPSIGGGGNDGINFKKNWKNHFIKFLSICHSVLNDLFADVIDLQDHEILEYSYGKEHERNPQYLVIQLYNYSSVLINMLLNQYPAPKSIPSDLILQFICRGLALNRNNIEKGETASIIYLRKVLPDIHCILLSLLKGLIVTCKTQLLPYSQLIFKIFKQNLDGTESDFTYGYEKPFRRLRIYTYETLCNWLVVGRNGNCNEVISIVISNAINDIKSKKNIIFLKETKVQNQSKDKEQMICQVDASKLCFAALKALQFLLKFGGTSIKPEEYKFLQEVIVKLLVQIQKCSTADVVPFATPSCRIELYSLLLELVYHPCPKWPPPTNFALRLFSRGINDTSSQVSLFCSAALSFLTIIIHPQFDNGGFPPHEVPESNNKTKAELQWREPREVEKEKGAEVFGSDTSEKAEDFSELDKTDFEPGKCSYINAESEVSSNEDSRNTITFLKEAVESCKKDHNIDEKKAEALRQVSPMAQEPVVKKQRPSEEELSLEKIPSPIKEKPLHLKSYLIEKTHESSFMDASNSKSVSPESINEECQPKARYFLRSKSKGSSEEPEEASKRTSSPDSLKSTPAKSLEKSAQSSKKRPRTKSASRVETKGKTPEKKSHNDEDIKAAFDDSFVD